MKVALVTGASSGIGRAIAIELHKKGYHIINASRRPEPKEGGTPTHELVNGEYMRVDLTYGSEVSFFVEKVKEKYDKVDVVVHNAGILPLKDKYTVSELEDLFWVNTLSPYFMTQELIFRGVLKEGGVVTFISSISGIRGEPDDIPYGASKAALIGMMKGFVQKYPQYRFVCIAPGLIKTWLVGDPEDCPQELIDRWW